MPQALWPKAVLAVLAPVKWPPAKVFSAPARPGSGLSAVRNRLPLLALPPVLDSDGMLSPAASGAKAPVKLAPEPEPEVADCVRVGVGVLAGSLVATPGRVTTQPLIAP